MNVIAANINAGKSHYANSTIASSMTTAAGGGSGGFVSVTGSGGAGKPTNKAPVAKVSFDPLKNETLFLGSPVPQKLLMNVNDYTDLIKCDRLATQDLMMLSNFQNFMKDFKDPYELFAETQQFSMGVKLFTTIFVFSNGEYTKIKMSTLEFHNDDISKWIMDRNHEQKLRPNEVHPNPFA